MDGDRWEIAPQFAATRGDGLDQDRFAAVPGALTTRVEPPVSVAAHGDVADTAVADGDAAPDDGEPDRLSEQAALRRRTLADVARELRVAGDRVVVGVGGRHVTGVVTHAAGDLATLDTPAGQLHVNLRRIAFVRVTEPAATPGVERSHGPSSFKARLFELELAGTPVGVGVDGEKDELGARIAAVGVDHLVLDRGGEGEWVVPLAGVVYVSVAADAIGEGVTTG